jgi:hypothetical protein
LSPKYLVVYELIHPHPIHPGRAQHKSKKKRKKAQKGDIEVVSKISGGL